MLPENGDEHEDRCDEDNCESDLRDGTRWERLDFTFGATSIFFLVPAWERSEEEETDECEDDCDDAVNNVSTQLITALNREEWGTTYSKYGKTIISLNWLASQSKFNGS